MLDDHVLGPAVEHVPDDEAVLRVARVSKVVIQGSVRRSKKSNFFFITKIHFKILKQPIS
jgi:hypothetical protein